MNCFLLFRFLKLNGKLYSHSSEWVKILKHILQEIWSLLMKTISTVHKLLFLKTTKLYTLDTKIWKNILSSYESKRNFLNMRTTKKSSTEDKTWNFHFARNYSKCLYRSSHQSGSVRKGVLRNFRKFTGKHLCQSLFFNNVAGMRPATLLKKRLWHRCFPMNFVTFLRTPFLQNTSGDRSVSQLSFENFWLSCIFWVKLLWVRLKIIKDDSKCTS